LRRREMEYIFGSTVSERKSRKVDSRILDICSNEIILGGGAVRSMITGEPISDYDLFFTGNKAVDVTKRYLVDCDFVKVFECPLGELTTYINGNVKVQLITKMFYTDPSHLVNSFDFTVTMFAWDGDKIYTCRRAIKDTRKKNLGINEVTFPVATINRIHKYRNKGYRFTEEFGKDLVIEINRGAFDETQLSLYVD